jgi:phosphate transport system substrate-binding protein
MKALAGFIYVVLGVILSGILGTGCKSYKEQDARLEDTAERGRIYVSADESFKPIIDEQVKVYESNHPGTTITVHYKAEAECLKDFGTDSIRMIIATRGFNESEKQFMIDSMKVFPRKMVVARDAIAIILHPQSPDSMLTMAQIRDILRNRAGGSGIQEKKKISKASFSETLIPVFDGMQATSTVRFIVDSVLRSDSLTKSARAARTSEEVIDYVATHPEAIGFIGVSWIGNWDDPEQLSFLTKVKMAALESTDSVGRYILPTQANIYYNRYPMVRDLVYTLKENHNGLGDAFADFMSGEIGQLIFKRAYLMPAQQKFMFRPIRLNEQ